MKRTFIKLTISCLFGGLLTTSTYSQSANTKIIQDDRLPELLKLKSEMTVNDELTDRYKIQLFYGNITEANKIHSKYNSKYPEWKPKIVYESPNYKVWVGNFRNRLEADQALLQIQKNFPNAFVMKPER